MNACAEFAPAFTPVDPDLTVDAFGSFLGQIEAKNKVVAGWDESYSLAAADRVDVVRALKLRTTEALSYVDSNSAWKVIAPKVKMPADKLRGFTPRVTKPPTTTPGAPVKRKRSKGDQSYEDIAGHLEKFIAALGGVPGYAPTSSALTISAFSGRLSQLRSINSTLCSDGPKVTLVHAQRSALYSGEKGLRARMKAIKKAVRAQYGTKSPQYVTAKSYKF